jgi:heterodisulfide reductase subunit B
VNSLKGSKFNLPVLYFTQVMGLAYGYPPKELGLDKIFVSADPVIRRVTKAEYEKQRLKKQRRRRPPKRKQGSRGRNSKEET